MFNDSEIQVAASSGGRVVVARPDTSRPTWQIELQFGRSGQKLLDPVRIPVPLLNRSLVVWDVHRFETPDATFTVYYGIDFDRWSFRHAMAISAVDDVELLRPLSSDQYGFENGIVTLI